MALSSINIVLGGDIKPLEKALDDAVAKTEKAGKELSQGAMDAVKKMSDQFQKLAQRDPSMATVRQLQNIAMTARALGPEFADLANEVVKAAGKMKDDIGDMRAEVSYFASDTRRLDAVLGGVQGIAGAFGAVEGALALAGVESKDMQQTMVKLQGAIALVNGVQAIQNALQAESAVRMGISAAATKLYSFATSGATAATRAFNASLAVSGIGLLVVAVGLLAQKFFSLGDGANAAAGKLADLKKEGAKLSGELQKLGETERQTAERTLAQIAKDRAKYEKERKYWYDEQWRAEKQADKDKAAIKIQEYDNMLTQLSINEAEANKTIQRIKDDATKTDEAKQKESNKKRIEAAKKRLESDIKLIHERHKGIEEAERYNIERNKKMREKAAQDLAKSKELTPANLIAGTAIPPILIPVAIDPNSYSQIVQDFKKLTDNIAGAVEQLGQDVAVMFGEAIGGAISGQENVLANFGDSVIMALGAFMSQVGKMLIAYAISIEKLQTAFAKPQEALAAGIVLVALGAAVRNTMKQGPQVQAFADGGIVSGPTLGLMGEYPGARTNPEVIAPLDKLQRLIKPDQSSGFVASTTIQGRDLAIVLERYNKDSRRG